MGFEYQNGKLFLIQGARKTNLLVLAKQTGRPFYVYDLDGMLSRLKFFKKTVAPAGVHYAVKANHHPEILKAFCKAGVGVDVVSGGEIERAGKAGFLGRDIIFSGVGKTESEIELALKTDILQFNVESVSELKCIARTAQKMGRTARVAFRINPDVDIDTHPYIKTGLRESKFGLDEECMPRLLEVLNKNPVLSFTGLALHIGSQIQDLTPLKTSIQRVKILYQKLIKDYPLSTFDCGGGLGIDYSMQADIKSDHRLIKAYGEYLNVLAKSLGREVRVLTEPGRVITARFACLIGQVQYIKNKLSKNFAVLNTGMHHLMRPCLYEAYHRILPLEKRLGEKKVYDIVGPICESSDLLGRDRVLAGLKEKDFLAVMDAGAYGAVMASSYNAHPFPKELVFTAP